jgi:hypothetical protein
VLGGHGVAHERVSQHEYALLTSPTQLIMLANMYSCYYDRGPTDGSTVPPRAAFPHSRYPGQFDVVGSDCDDWVWIDVYCGVVGSLRWYVHRLPDYLRVFTLEVASWIINGHVMSLVMSAMWYRS